MSLFKPQFAGLRGTRGWQGRRGVRAAAGVRITRAMANAYMRVVPLDHARHDVGTGAGRARSKVKRPGLLHLGVCEKGGDGVQPMRAGGGNGGNVTEGLTCKHFARNLIFLR